MLCQVHEKESYNIATLLYTIAIIANQSTFTTTPYQNDPYIIPNYTISLFVVQFLLSIKHKLIHFHHANDDQDPWKKNTDTCNTNITIFREFC